MTVVNVYNATSFDMVLTLNGQPAGTIPAPPPSGVLQPLAVPFNGSNVQPPGAFGTNSQLIANAGGTSWLYGVEIDNGNPWEPFTLVVFVQGAFLGGNACEHPISAAWPPRSRARAKGKQDGAEKPGPARRASPAPRR